MDPPRLQWEPLTGTPLEEVAGRFEDYLAGKSSGVTLLGNGTLLFTDPDRDFVADARRAINEAAFLLDFKVSPLKEGGYMVSHHKAVAQFVSVAEWDLVKDQVALRVQELLFPSETFFGANNEHYLIGLYARGKLQRDAHHFSYFKRIGR